MEHYLDNAHPPANAAGRADHHITVVEHYLDNAHPPAKSGRTPPAAAEGPGAPPH